MSKKIEYRDEDVSIGRGWSKITEHDTYREGIVYTPYGIVDVYSQKHYSSVRVAHNGRYHSRRWYKASSALALTRHANKFIRELMEVK